MSLIYLIGSLRNMQIPHIAQALRQAGHEVYDDWFSGGREADEEWQRHERIRGRAYVDALEGWHAKQVFEMDLRHLKRADTGVLVLPAGKSAHLELGWLLGQGKYGYVLLDKEPERFDIMYRFAHKVCVDMDDLIKAIDGNAPGLRTTDHAPWNA